MGIAQRAKSLRSSRSTASIRSFPPAASIKCDGPALYRSQASRDVACILDLNPSVTSWRCMPLSLELFGDAHVPDFVVLDSYGSQVLMDAPDRLLPCDAPLIEKSADGIGLRYRLVSPEEIYDGPRLQNARDLLRYGSVQLALGDRLKVLAVLNDEGSLTVAECLTIFTETRPPIAGLAQMILRGFVEVDLDTDLLGPETAVRRIRG